MNAATWCACTDPDPMLPHLPRKTSDRKRRLFLCGCARNVWKFLTYESDRMAVEIAERFADGEAPPQVLDAAHEGAAATERPVQRRVFDGDLGPVAWALTRSRARGDQQMLAMDDERIRQAILVRDVFGNPFRKVHWTKREKQVGSTVINLAQAIYDDRTFERLPLLADALEDAGCHHEDILAHCRGPGPHVRGCWVVDLLLEKQ